MFCLVLVSKLSWKSLSDLLTRSWFLSVRKFISILLCISTSWSAWKLRSERKAPGTLGVLHCIGSRISPTDFLFLFRTLLHKVNRTSITQALQECSQCLDIFIHPYFSAIKTGPEIRNGEKVSSFCFFLPSVSLSSLQLHCAVRTKRPNPCLLWVKHMLHHTWQALLTQIRPPFSSLHLLHCY